MKTNIGCDSGSRITLLLVLYFVIVLYYDCDILK